MRMQWGDEEASGKNVTGNQTLAKKVGHLAFTLNEMERHYEFTEEESPGCFIGIIMPSVLRMIMTVWTVLGRGRRGWGTKS